MYLSDEFRLKAGLAEMLKGGVIMDVTNVEQAKIAEKAGASAVMVTDSEAVPTCRVKSTRKVVNACTSTPVRTAFLNPGAVTVMS